MSDNVIISFIGGVFVIANTCVTLILTNRLKMYRHEVNGMKKELVEAVKGKGEAEGNLQGRLEQTAENKKIT